MLLSMHAVFHQSHIPAPGMWNDRMDWWERITKVNALDWTGHKLAHAHQVYNEMSNYRKFWL